MADVLTQIIADKRVEVAARKARRPLAALMDAARSAPAPRGFAAHLTTAAQAGFALIAEIKKASPSHGLIRADCVPSALARAYRAGGAACLSILTDTPYFQGEDGHVAEARAAVPLPILRKDFTIDPYQVVEARLIGADGVLVILAAMDDRLAAELLACARDFALDVLVEVHDEAELARALALGAPLLGINNRNLKTLAVDLATSERLAALAGDHPGLVAESGLKTHDDLVRLARHGIRRFLVGESLMRQADVAAATRALLAGDGAVRASA
ncbi:MAG: indole-3-glycerol phosphate synthase TrpC [Alphaproteobacteria bacterium]|nr:indole-3-glycerol phosphate synthase TrpC [Alphaproteobacteria bacterium]